MRKKVLITGAAGFVGHHLVDFLLTNTDWDIISLDRLDYSGNLNRLDEVVMAHPPKERKRVKVVFHDLKAEVVDLTRNMLGDINVIIHLAAASHVDRSISNPMEFLMDNTVGTVNLLNYARTLPNLERFINFSTDEIFGAAPEGVLYKEYDRYNSTNPYSASKAAAEEFCVAYENTYKIPMFVSHTMNIIGERQHPEKFVPMCIRKIRDNEKIYIHSNPEKTKAGSRFYIYVKDVCEAVFFLLNLDSNQKIILEEEMKKYGVRCPKFNIVGKEEIDNLTMVKYIGNSFENKTPQYEMVDFHSSRPGHDLRYSLDGSLMKRLGWEPKISLEKRLHDITRWTLNNRKWIDL